MMKKSPVPAKIGDVLFTNKGWKKVIGLNPFTYSEETIALPIPDEFRKKYHS